MKASRKLNRGSFINRVSGGAPPRPAAAGGKAPPENDHDLMAPPEPAGEPGQGDKAG